MKADLHVHTDISDGSFGLEEVIDMAIKNGVTHLGITNHDTVKGLKEAVEKGKSAGMKIIPGIEISSCNPESNKKIHILGFNFDLKGINIRKVCDQTLQNRHKNSLWQIRQLIKNGYVMDVANIYARAENSEVIYKQHIMAELVDKKYTDKIYSDLYRKLFKGSGICARDIEYADAYEAVKAIKKDGGIAILAHPGQLDSYNFIEKLVEAGLDGIEMYHEDHHEEDHKKVAEYCRKYNLIATGGSDFHGDYGTDINIGQILSPKEFLHVFDSEIIDLG